MAMLNNQMVYPHVKLVDESIDTNIKCRKNAVNGLYTW